MNSHVFMCRCSFFCRCCHLFKYTKFYKFPPKTKMSFDRRSIIYTKTNVISITILSFLNKCSHSMPIHERVIRTNTNDSIYIIRFSSFYEAIKNIILRTTIYHFSFL